MTAAKKQKLFAMPQADRNEIVGKWAQKAGWAIEDRVGSDNVIYRAFWPENVSQRA